MDPHVGGGDEPDLVFEIGVFVGFAGGAGLAPEADTVGRGDGIEQLVGDLGRVHRGEICIDHIIGQRLFPQADVGAAVLDIKLELRRCRDLEVNLVDRCEVGQGEPRHRRRHQHEHRNDAEQEGELSLDARLGFLQFVQLQQELLTGFLFHNDLLSVLCKCIYNVYDKVRSSMRQDGAAAQDRRLFAEKQPPK